MENNRSKAHQQTRLMQCMSPSPSVDTLDNVDGISLHTIASHCTKFYDSEVSIPAHYTEEKREKKKRFTFKNFVRRYIGIPFALLYGVALYMIIDSTILSPVLPNGTKNISKPHKYHMDLCPSLSNNNTNTSFINSVIISVHHLRNKTNETEPDTSKSKRGILDDFSSQDKLFISIGISMSIIGIISIFSRNIRCSMLLIMPGLITGRCRMLLFTLIMNYIFKHPIAGIHSNLKQMVNSAGCLYRSLLTVICANLLHVNSVFQHVDNILKSVKQAVDIANKMLETLPISVKVQVNVNTNMTQIDFRKLIQVAKVPELFEDFSNEFSKLLNAASYVDLIRKMITILSIILLIVDAVRYLRKYYIDSSFDNMYIGRTIRRLWKKKGMEVFTLRRWEINKGYKCYKKFTKLTRRELYTSMRNCAPTFFLFLVCLMLVGLDIILAQTVETIKNKKDFSVLIHGMHHNYSKVSSLHLPSFNITAQPCDIKAVYTDQKYYAIILSLLFASAISCFLEVWLFRSRVRMCNLFYPDKSKERADYLHYRLLTGRIMRKARLLLIVRREKERQAKMRRFSPRRRLKHFLCSCFASLKKKFGIISRFLCPGCGWRTLRTEGNKVSFTAGEREVNDEMICQDCYKDFPQNEQQQQQ